jgi:hypothetical protein
LRMDAADLKPRLGEIWRMPAISLADTRPGARGAVRSAGRAFLRLPDSVYCVAISSSNWLYRDARSLN